MSNLEDQKTDQFKAYQPENNEIDIWIAEGETKLQNKDYREAVKMFEKVLRVEPDNLTAYEKHSIARSALADVEHIADFMMTGKELMKHHDWAAAREEFQAVLDIDSAHSEAIECLATVEKNLGLVSGDNGVNQGPDEMLLEKDNFEVSDNAISTPDKNQDTEVFRPVKQKNVNNENQSDELFQNRLEQALNLYESGNLNDAKKILETLQESYSDHPQIKFYLTAIDRRIETDDIRKNQFATEEMLKKGMDCLDNENYVEAQKIFSELLAVRPDFTQAKMMLQKTQSMLESADKKHRKKKTVQLKTDSKTTDYSTKKHKIESVQRRPIPPSGTFRKKLFFISVAVAAMAGIASGIWFFTVLPATRYDDFLEKAQLYIESSSYSNAQPLLESALQIQPDSVEALMLLGHVMMETGNSARAVTIFEEAIKYDTAENHEILYALGAAYYAAEEWSLAKETLQKVSDNTKFGISAKFYIAMAHKNQGHYESASELFHEVIELDETNAEAFFNLAECYVEMKMATEAIEAYNEAIRLNPQFVDAYTRLAEFYQERKQFNRGIEVLESLLEWYTPRTLELSKHVAEILLFLGNMQHEAGDFRAAIDSFSQIIKIEPSVEAYRNLGRSHYRMERLNEAIMVWRKGLELDSTDSDLWWQIGVAQFRMGDTVSAEVSYKEALRYDPDYFKALTNLGFLYYQQYKYELARRYWRRSLELEPNQPRVRQIMSSIDR